MLPQPLSKEEETRFIGMLDGTDSPKARQILIERNLRLVAHIANKFNNTGIERDDLISIGTIGLIKAVNTFKPAKNIKIATYAARCISNEILMFLRRNKRIPMGISADEPISTDANGNELLLSDILGTDGSEIFRNIEAEENHGLVTEAIYQLSERDRRIIVMRFGLDKDAEPVSQKKAAQCFNISQAHMSRLEKQILSRLKKIITRTA